MIENHSPLSIATDGVPMVIVAQVLQCVLELRELHLGIALYTTVVYSTSKVLCFIALYSSSELREIYGAVN